MNSVYFALPACLKAEPKNLTGWGRTHPVSARVVHPSTLAELQELVRAAPSRTLIARGLGRSYGDAAQLDGGTVIELPAFNRIDLDPTSCSVTAGAGVSLDQILRVIVPAGFSCPLPPAPAT